VCSEYKAYTGGQQESVMIFLVAPVWMERIDECRAFLSYSAMETYVLTHAQQRKLWNGGPPGGMDGGRRRKPGRRRTTRSRR